MVKDEEEQLEENETIANETVEQEETSQEEVAEEIFIVNKKCRYSAIANSGCRWNDDEKTSFNIKIISAAKETIPGVWFFITGESGAIKTVKRPGIILSEGTRSYNVDYTELTDELGRVKKFEIYPIEVVDEVEYACENQRVYTIPETYCKANGPVSID